MTENWNPQITKEQFEEQYCKNSGITIETYRKYFVVMPCDCRAGDCQGWVSIHNNHDNIQHQKRFYYPSKQDIKSYEMNTGVTIT